MIIKPYPSRILVNKNTDSVIFLILLKLSQPLFYKFIINTI